MLYGLWVRHRSDALSGATGERKAPRDKEESNREDRCGSIVMYAVQAERVGRGGKLVQVVNSKTIIILDYKTEADRGLETSDLEM